jgi:hypothetical protein
MGADHAPATSLIRQSLENKNVKVRFRREVAFAHLEAGRRDFPYALAAKTHEICGKRQELLIELLPGARRMTALADPRVQSADRAFSYRRPSLRSLTSHQSAALGPEHSYGRATCGYCCCSQRWVWRVAPIPSRAAMTPRAEPWVLRGVPTDMTTAA